MTSPTCNTSAPFHDPTWSARLEPLLASGRRCGADLVEFFLERTDHLSLLAEQELITSVSPSFGMGAGIRVFRGHRDGFVSTNDLTPAGLMRALEQALAMLGLESSAAAPMGSFDGLPPLRDHGTVKGDWLDRCPSLADASGRLLQGTALLDRHGSHLQARRASYSRSWQDVLVVASDNHWDPATTPRNSWLGGFKVRPRCLCV